MTAFTETELALIAEALAAGRVQRVEGGGWSSDLPDPAKWKPPQAANTRRRTGGGEAASG